MSSRNLRIHTVIFAEAAGWLRPSIILKAGYSVRKQHPRTVHATLRKVLFLVALALSMVATMSAQPGKPNFTGQWQMDDAKSNFGAFPKPTYILRSIVHKDPELTVATTQRGINGEKTAHALYRTDGVDTTNQFSTGEGTSHAFWDGNTLVIRTDMKGRNDLAVQMEERWSLSPDGKTLTTTSHIETSKGTTDLTLVCIKVK